jgi:hypothetical protein
MINDSKKVYSVENNSPKKGWKITWEDGKRDVIFNKDWLPLLEEAKEHNLPINFTKEKEGDYWHIMTIDLSHEPAQIIKSDPTGNSIEAQTAYKGAIELMANKIITPDSMLGQAAISWGFTKLGVNPPLKTTTTEKPEELFPEDTPNHNEKPPETQQTVSKSLRDPSTLKNYGEALKAIHADFRVQPAAALKEAGVSSTGQLSITPAELYLVIAERYK